MDIITPILRPRFPMLCACISQHEFHVVVKHGGGEVAVKMLYVFPMTRPTKFLAFG